MLSNLPGITQPRFMLRRSGFSCDPILSCCVVDNEEIFFYCVRIQLDKMSNVPGSPQALNKWSALLSPLQHYF